MSQYWERLGWMQWKGEISVAIKPYHGKFKKKEMPGKLIKLKNDFSKKERLFYCN